MVIPEQNKENIWGKDFKDLISQSKVLKFFKELSRHVHGGFFITDSNIPTEVLNYYIANEIIEETEKRGVFKFTEKGKYFLKKFSETV